MPEEIGLLIQAGYSIPEAVRCATRISASLLGLDGAGRLAAGAAATFVVVKVPPEDIPGSLERIKGLFIDGKQIV